MYTPPWKLAHVRKEASLLKERWATISAFVMVCIFAWWIFHIRETTIIHVHIMAPRRSAFWDLPMTFYTSILDRRAFTLWTTRTESSTIKIFINASLKRISPGVYPEKSKGSKWQEGIEMTDRQAGFSNPANSDTWWDRHVVSLLSCDDPRQLLKGLTAFKPIYLRMPLFPLREDWLKAYSGACACLVAFVSQCNR